MKKEEMYYKVEYMELTCLIKIRAHIMFQKSLLDYYQQSLRFDSNPEFSMEHFHRIIPLITENIQKLLNLVFSPSIYQVEQEIERLDYIVKNEVLPKVIKHLVQGHCNYEWSFCDYGFDYTMFIQNPDVKKAYRRQLELKKLEQSLVTEDVINNGDCILSVDNPIYFDIYYLTYRDMSYMPFLDEIITNQLYNPNHLNCLSSNEPFFDKIMDFGELDLINLVSLDERTNFSLLTNGVDYLNSVITMVANEYCDLQILNPYFFTLSTIFKKRDISLLDTTRFQGNSRVDGCSAYISNLISFFNFCNLKEVQDLVSYCISDQAIEKQLYISKYPSLDRDYAIDNYCNFIRQRRLDNVEMVSKLKLLKLYPNLHSSCNEKIRIG